MEGDGVCFNIKGGQVKNDPEHPVKFFVTAAAKHEIFRKCEDGMCPDTESQTHMDNRFSYYGPFSTIKQNRDDLKDFGKLSEQNVADWCLWILDKMRPPVVLPDRAVALIEEFRDGAEPVYTEDELDQFSQAPMIWADQQEYEGPQPWDDPDFFIP